MSEINSFSDYTNKYNSNVDYSALFGETSNSSSLGWYKHIIRLRIYKKWKLWETVKSLLCKAGCGKNSRNGRYLTEINSDEDQCEFLKKSADALNASSLWEKKKIKKKDEKTGEETEVEDYDWEAITKAVKSFIEDYNDVVKEAGESNTKDVLRNAAWMTGMTDKSSNMQAVAVIRTPSQSWFPA